MVWQDGTAVPDTRRILPGRGAYLHPRAECLTGAERSRALQRALRVDGSLDTGALRDLIG